MLLEARNLHIGYGDAPAVWDVSLDVDGGEIVSVIGPNGAGKTTLINAIAGLLRCRQGTLRFDGADMTRVTRARLLRPRHRAGARRAGGCSPRCRSRRISSSAAICRRRAPRGLQSLERVYGLFPILRDKRRQPAGELSGGQQQMVAIGRALMARPRIVLFDEPSLGLAPTIVDDMFDIIARVRDDGAAVLLVEQNVLKALDIADRAYVLEQGRIVAQGLPDDLLKQPHIREAYLGV